MKLSIIVPVYNCENYLAKCIDSLLNQDLQEEYEIIIVNDGSTDESEQIMQAYAKKYPEKIQAFSKENGGQSSARNLGLQYAKGEFLSFIDSDDWLDLDFYSKGIQEAQQGDYDVIVYDMIDHYPTYDVHHECSKFDDKFKMTMSASNKIFRASVVGDIRFMEGVWYEDLEFTARILLINDRIGSVYDSYYHCHCRDVSTMTNNNAPKNLDILTVFDSLLSFAKEHNVYEQYQDTLTYMILDHILITSINRVAKMDHPEKETVIRQLRQYVEQHVSHVSATLKRLGFSRNRRLIAMLNYHRMHHVSEKILSLSAKSKGR